MTLRMAACSELEGEIAKQPKVLDVGTQELHWPLSSRGALCRGHADCIHLFSDPLHNVYSLYGVLLLEVEHLGEEVRHVLTIPIVALGNGGEFV